MRINSRYEIWTPDGFAPFLGIKKTEQETLKICTNTGELICTSEHKLQTRRGWIAAAALTLTDVLWTEEGWVSITSVLPQGLHDVFDPVEVGLKKEYYANGVLSHNCEFVSSDALLISSIKLNELRWEQPLWESLGFKFWVPPEELGGRDKIYMLALDPATGSGNDFSAIQVFDFPGLRQIAEYRSNDINIPLLYAKLSWLLRRLTELTNNGRAEVLWTFERNGIGEAVSALYYNDEAQVEEAELVSDHPAKHGVYTTGRQKILTALQLKNLVEKNTDPINIKSKDLIHELKHFVAKGGSYEAKSGATDDCVMATLGIMRLLKRLSEYNAEAFNKVNEYVDPEAPMDQSNEPMPFTIF